MTPDTIHYGDLVIDDDVADDAYAHLTAITGDLDIRSTAKLTNLTRVGGYFENSAPDVELPALRSVGGAFYTGYDVSLPALETIGTSVSISGCLTAPKLRSVYGRELPDAELAAARIENVALAALATETSLEMASWHRCDTTHCIAGWGIHQAGKSGYELEAQTDAETAGLILLGVEAANQFFVSNDDARTWLRSKLDTSTAEHA